MNFNDYQKFTRTTAIYKKSPSRSHILSGINLDDVIYITLGLVGESGEVAEKIKKVIRDCGGKIDTGKAKEIIQELGDVLYYVARLADHFE